MSEVKDLEKIVNAQTIHYIAGQPLVVVPEGYSVEDLEHCLPAPRRIRAHPTFRAEDSFIEYVRRFATGSSAVFADEENLKIQAIIDYHNDSPSWCDHGACFNCQLSKEWKAWVSSDGQSKDQCDFAEFLEERAQDIVDPSGAELLEIALQFQVIRKAVFGSAIRLNTGEFQFQFSEENQKKGTVELPEVITIGVTPFRNGEKYEVKARLSYRLREGKLTLSYRLIEPHRIIEHAFRELINKVASELDGIPVYEAMV